jgi:hypothetical protein
VPGIKKGAWSEPFGTCGIRFGPAAPSPPWPNATAKPGCGAIRWRISAVGREPTAAPWLNTDRVESVCSRKTIYVRFDLNDYSIPPEAVGRPLTLVASDTTVRLLDGTVEIARHLRSYDRQQPVLDPAHQEAVLKLKRKAFHATAAGRLEQVVPESKTLLDLAFAQGESAGSQTVQLLKLLDEFGPAALRRAIAEALERKTPRACSVAFLLRRLPHMRRVALDLSRHPEAQCIEVRPHNLETYDELARTQNDDDPE